MSISFYGLLIVPEEGERTANLPPGKSPLDTYLRCASLCARSFGFFGYEWTLVTDDADLVAARCRSLQIEGLPLLETEFRLQVPAEIPFRAAHYKLELVKRFGGGQFGARPALVDLDTVCLRPLPAELGALEGIAAYRIGSSEGSECSDPRLAASLACLLEDGFREEWWGGEFLLGDSASFADLGAHIDAVWPAYIANWQFMLHAGDEMVLGAALQRFESGGGSLVDARDGDAVARYWTSRTKHNPRPFRDLDDVAILHLPADKDFLSAASKGPFDPQRFRRKLDRHVRAKVALRRLSFLARRDAALPPRYR